jgi:hypothetical protein
MLEEHQVPVLTPPHWLLSLVELIDEAIDESDLVGPLAYSWLEPETVDNPLSDWLVVVYPTLAVEAGGPNDGGLLAPGFALDLYTVTDAFSPLTDLAWISPARYTGHLDGPHLMLAGKFAGQRVELRIFDLPPHGTPPSLIVNHGDGGIREIPGEQRQG